MARLVAVGRRRSPVTPQHFAWQAWHLETSTFVLRGMRATGCTWWRAWSPLVAVGRRWSPLVAVGRRWSPLVAGYAAALCVAGVALGDIYLPFTWQAWHLATSMFVSRGRRGTWRHLPSFCVAGVLQVTSLTRHPSHHFVTHHLSHTIFHTTLSHTHHVSHTVTDHLSHTISHIPLCLTPSLTHHPSHHFVTHTIFHHTIFHTQLRHPPSFSTPSLTHLFVTHHLSAHHLSHTTLSHTIFHTQLCHALSFTYTFTHTIFHTQLCHTHTPSFFVTDHVSYTTLPHTTLSFLLSLPRYNIWCFLLEEVALWGYPVL